MRLRLRRSPLLVTAGVLVLTVSAVVAVKFVRTYDSASAGSPPPATGPLDGTGGPGVPGWPPASGGPNADYSVDSVQQARFQAAAVVVQKAKGHLGVVVHDRKNGTDWRAGEVGHASWASSTVKLAMATNLLERGRTGEIKLDTSARKNIADMLDTSSDPAANTLWDRYGKDAFVPWFQQQYGMTNLQFADGAPHRWDQLRCTPDDLVHLMSFVLERDDQTDRDYLVASMRRAGNVQHWGVWAAGAANQPGVKNGWALESDGNVKHWVAHSVGFVGLDAQYVVAIMFDQAAGPNLDVAVHTVSDIIATAFGAPVPAVVTVP